MLRVQNMKQKSVDVHDFAMNPHTDVPRSSFRMQKMHKTAFSFSYLVPIGLEEILPGDTWRASITAVCRTAVPITPIMDNWHLEFFSFYVPARLLWTNFQKFMGEQDNPGDSISFTLPVTPGFTSGNAIGSLADYFGLPTAGQVTGGLQVGHQVLPLRAYNQIYNAWFRDENLQNSVPKNVGDGPDTMNDYVLLKRGKRHDYFTAALPWPQKGNTAVTLPLGSEAVVKTKSTATVTGAQQPLTWLDTAGAAPTANRAIATAAAGGTTVFSTTVTVAGNSAYPSNLFADLSTATAATINQLRQSFAIQALLEKDARGGTRYIEIIRNHFGVVSPDARLDRPEYIGGGRVPIIVNAIPQTSQTGLTGGTTPMGTLAASGHAAGSTGFTYNSTEHGYIITLASARADLTYQQGLRRLWSRSTRYDFYLPVFANLGEQTILNKEIYADGSANDALVFGYIPRWDEYRTSPSQISGIFRSTAASTIDYWHSAQKFTALPTLNATFITDDSATVTQRNFAGGAITVNQQLLCDFFFDMQVARAIPVHSIPGMVTKF